MGRPTNNQQPTNNQPTTNSQQPIWPNIDNMIIECISSLMRANNAEVEVFSTSVYKKDKNDEYIRAYFNVYLSKNVNKDFINYEDKQLKNGSYKCEMLVKHGWITVDNKGNPALFINEIIQL